MKTDEKKTITNDEYLALIGIVYVAREKAREIDSLGKAITKMLREKDYAMHTLDAIHSTEPIVESIIDLLEKNNIKVAE